MSKSIEKRIDKIEQKLSIGKKALKQMCLILSFNYTAPR